MTGRYTNHYTNAEILSGGAQSVLRTPPPGGAPCAERSRSRVHFIIAGLILIVVSSIIGLVVEYIVAIDVTRVRFPDDAPFFDRWSFSKTYLFLPASCDRRSVSATQSSLGSCSVKVSDAGFRNWDARHFAHLSYYLLYSLAG